MLERIKKKQESGFKEFVVSMESANSQRRTQIFTTGVLEDPLYMAYVVKNIKVFEDVLKLDPSDINSVLTLDKMIIFLAKALSDLNEEDLQKFEQLLIPKHVAKLREELKDLNGQVTVLEREGAKQFILMNVRKFQLEERIPGFAWSLPPKHLYVPQAYKDGPFMKFFEDGAKAVEGKYLKGKREGEWKHYYDKGSKFAEGEYLNGFKNGHWYFYYRDGKIRSEGIYVQDQKDGPWKEWDRDGNFVEVNYIEGVKAS
jgi:hypothetical protein